VNVQPDLCTSSDREPLNTPVMPDEAIWDGPLHKHLTSHAMNPRSIVTAQVDPAQFE
jgi:hypothetical protein